LVEQRALHELGTLINFPKKILLNLYLDNIVLDSYHKKIYEELVWKAEYSFEEIIQVLGSYISETGSKQESLPLTDFH
jgi:hypothetical protein